MLFSIVENEARSVLSQCCSTRFTATIHFTDAPHGKAQARCSVDNLATFAPSVATFAPSVATFQLPMATSLWKVTRGKSSDFSWCHLLKDRQESTHHSSAVSCLPHRPAPKWPEVVTVKSRVGLCVAQQSWAAAVKERRREGTLREETFSETTPHLGSKMSRAHWSHFLVRAGWKWKG